MTYKIKIKNCIYQNLPEVLLLLPRKKKKKSDENAHMKKTKILNISFPGHYLGKKKSIIHPTMTNPR